jgi:hypothetical protein
VVLLLEVEVDLVRDPEGVLDHIRAVGKGLPHLVRTLEVEPVVVPHPVRVGLVLSEADAEQRVVRLVVALLQEVGVVRGDHRKVSSSARSRTFRFSSACPSEPCAWTSR